MDQLQPTAVEQFFKSAVRAPSSLQIITESRVVLELGQFLQSLFSLDELPLGDGHPVMVLPGFLTNDQYTLLLRWFLKNRGYDVYPWELGTNIAFKINNIKALQQKICMIRQATGRRRAKRGWV